jgi:hypothetical protein
MRFCSSVILCSVDWYSPTFRGKPVNPISLKMGQTGCPETSVLTSNLRYVSEERRSYLHHGVSPKSSKLPNSLTLRSKVLPQNLTDTQFVKKFPALNGTQRLITAPTIARHLFPFAANFCQF